MKYLDKYIDIIKKDKKNKRIITYFLFMMLLVTIGFSISTFTSNNLVGETNITVNGLSFNMTTNGGTSDDRILHLKAGEIEQFKIILTNLNDIDTKYELYYELCNNSNCTETSKEIPDDIIVMKSINGTDDISGTIKSGNNYKKNLKLITANNSTKDYFIKLNLKAGYNWNDLDKYNQITESYSGDIPDLNIIAYVDGEKVNTLPTTCAYAATVKAYTSGSEVENEGIGINCDYYSNKWSVSLTRLRTIPDKIVLDFVSVDIPADAVVQNLAYITGGSNPYHTYVAPVSGYYQLEVWGAQGGTYNSTYYGGYGGYSYGIMYLNKGEQVYIYIGGKGSGPSTSTISGGYNGGGTSHGSSSDGIYVCSGGGATHIAYATGLLSTLSSKTESVILVASGGGGAGYWGSNSSFRSSGGSGGGYLGCSKRGGGGSQTSGGTATSYGKSGTFGAGGSYNASTPGYAEGGGGGWYGGGGGYVGGGAGGGSGYINSSYLVKNKRYMFCYGCAESREDGIFTMRTDGITSLTGLDVIEQDKTNCPNGYSTDPISKCAKAGDGHARITFLPSFIPPAQ